jgi:hypothetical protein
LYSSYLPLGVPNGLAIKQQSMSKKQDDLIADLQETFNNLRNYNMMLNPTKCVFGVPAGQLLGFIVSHRGIEVNSEKIKAILEISRPNDLKDVQRLTGYMAALSRFIRLCHSTS